METISADVEKVKSFLATMTRADLRLMTEVSEDLIALLDKYSDRELGGESGRQMGMIFGGLLEIMMNSGYCEHQLVFLVETLAAAKKAGLDELAFERERELTALRLVEAPKPVLGLKGHAE